MRSSWLLLGFPGTAFQSASAQWSVLGGLVTARLGKQAESAREGATSIGENDECVLGGRRRAHGVMTHESSDVSSSQPWVRLRACLFIYIERRRSSLD